MAYTAWLSDMLQPTHACSHARCRCAPTRQHPADGARLAAQGLSAIPSMSFLAGVQAASGPGAAVQQARAPLASPRLQHARQGLMDPGP